MTLLAIAGVKNTVRMKQLPRQNGVELHTTMAISIEMSTSRIEIAPLKLSPTLISPFLVSVDSLPAASDGHT